MNPDAAERLRQLEAEVQRLKEQMAAPREAEEGTELSPTAEEPPEEDETPPRELTPQEQAEFDSLIKQAHLAKIRNQAAVATELLKKAERISPKSPVVLEAIGDDYAARRNFKAAKEAYAKALKYDPANVALDKKYGEAVFYSDARLAGMMVNVPDDSMASGTASIFLSIFLPGVGQMVRGKWAKGILILGGFLTCLAIFIFMRPSNPRAAQEAKFTMLFPIAGAIVFWLWGFLDSQGGAKSVGKRQINRPTPPVDLPFE